jgi:hypothetical protein
VCVCVLVRACWSESEWRQWNGGRPSTDIPEILDREDSRLGITCHPKEKAKATADSLENQFTSHDLCDENHERRVEIRVQVLLASVDDTHLRKVWAGDIHKLINSLKLRKACVLDGIQNECLQHLPRRSLGYLIHLFNYCLQLSHFLKPWKETNVIRLPKPGKDAKFPHNLFPIGLLSTTSKLF